jgi:hypothetical protein
MVNRKHSVPSKQKFEPTDWKKKLHHVVPVAWQKKFSSPGHPGCALLQKPTHRPNVGTGWSRG